METAGVSERVIPGPWSFRSVQLHCRNGSDSKSQEAVHVVRGFWSAAPCLSARQRGVTACCRLAVCFQDGLFAGSSDGRKGNKSSLVGSPNAGDRDQLRARRALIMRSRRYDNSSARCVRAEIIVGSQLCLPKHTHAVAHVVEHVSACARPCIP